MRRLQTGYAYDVSLDLKSIALNRALPFEL